MSLLSVYIAYSAVLSVVNAASCICKFDSCVMIVS